MKRLLLSALILLLIVAGCQLIRPAPAETDVQIIPLTKPINVSKAEISGLAWYRDWLFFLPQYPSRFKVPGKPKTGGALLALPKQQILDYLDGKIKGPLDPVPISFNPDGIDKRTVPGYQGFESIVFDGNRVYMTIEAGSRYNMHGYIVAGEIKPDLSLVSVDRSTLTEIPLPRELPNLSDEAALLADGQLLTFYEANGRRVNPHPTVQEFDRDLQWQGTLTMPNLEYRITDVTPLDLQGRFWAVNQFSPVDLNLLTRSDPLAKRWGRGESHRWSLAVERLVEFQYTPEGISLVADQAPIQLKIGALLGRNWEGIARLDERGLLIASDRYPDTLFGFVPLPAKEAAYVQ